MPSIQSDENVIQTDLIHTALSLALVELRVLREHGELEVDAPHSTVGLLMRAKEARVREIRRRLVAQRS